MSDEKVDAWMPLWIGSYLADTMHLSRDSHGGYLLLLFAYWRNKGPLPDDDEDLAGITKAAPQEWKKLRPKLAKFFTVADGVWTHGRADRELVKAGVHKAAAVKRASAGGQALAEKRRKQAEHGASSTASSTSQSALGECTTPLPSSLRSETEDGWDKPPPSSAAGFDDLVPIRPAVAVSIALRKAGVASANASHPRLMALVDSGATSDEFLAMLPAALKANPSDPFRYLLGAVEGERTRATATAGQLHKGAMPVRLTPAEQRVADSSPHLLAPHLRAAMAAHKPQTEVFDVIAREVD
jgi:uncharacterized protein YdaU (DUF1376 family)